MITQQGVPFVYDFNKSYYENFYSNKLGGMSGSGLASVVLDSEHWQAHDATTTVNGVVVNNGVDVANYISNVYNGDTPICMLDKIAREIGEFLGKIGGDFGCDLGQVIHDIIDAFTDVFGSFICTATLDAGDCGKELLNELKNYRDLEVLSDKKGRRIVKYYTVLGPKIVSSVDGDKDKDVVYRYLLAHHIIPLKQAVDSANKEKVYSIYFRLMDEMVDRYGLKVSKEYKEWSKEYR